MLRRGGRIVFPVDTARGYKFVWAFSFCLHLVLYATFVFLVAQTWGEKHHDPLSDFCCRPELTSKIHRQFRNAHEGHRPHAGLDPSRASTGVVWTTERAYEHGFLVSHACHVRSGQIQASRC